jgi:quercetin dioxygenase-like cupin family protein
MSRLTLASLMVAVLAAGGFVACSEDAPTSPSAAHSMKGATHNMTDVSHMMTAEAVTPDLEPFTFRAPLDPYKIQQLPDFMILSNARTDIVFQRIVLSATSPFGMWHTHPGPSFVYVIAGQTKLQRFDPKDGCTETPVSGPGSAYFEVANQVHRAVVVSAEPAVLLVTRFNIPVGQPFTIPVPPDQIPSC